MMRSIRSIRCSKAIVISASALAVLGIAMTLSSVAQSQDPVIDRAADSAPGDEKAGATEEAAMAPTTGPVPLAPEWPFGEVPLAYGVEIPAETVNGLLRRCGCPLLPDQGPASPQHVSAAWTNSIGDIVLEYDHGVKMAFEAGWEDETNENWISFMRTEAIPDQGWGRILSARDGDAFGRERDEGQVGVVAVLHWLEGTRFITVGGHGGETLSELVDFAESLPHCEGCTL